MSTIDPDLEHEAHDISDLEDVFAKHNNALAVLDMLLGRQSK